MGLGSTGAAWHGGQSSAAVKHPSESNTQHGGFPASADPLKNPTGTGMGLWRVCCDPECPAPAPIALCPHHPSGSQDLTCVSWSANRHLASVKKVQRSHECSWGCHIPLLMAPPSPLRSSLYLEWMSEQLWALGLGVVGSPQLLGGAGTPTSFQPCVGSCSKTLRLG